MTTPLFFLPSQVAIDSDGNPVSGAKLYTYAAGTLTDQETYTDAALAVAHTNPVVANSGGRFDPIFLQNKQYRFILKTSADVEIYDVDNYAPFPSTGLGSAALSKSGNYQLLTSDRDKFVSVDATATITLPTLADAGTGWAIGVINTGTGIVTVDGSGAETVNGASSIYLEPGASVTMTNDGNAWFGPTMRTYGTLWVTPYTVQDTDILNLVAIAAGSGTVTLPVAADVGSGYRVWLFNKNSGSAFTLDGDGSETIDNRTSILMDRGQIAMLLCDGSNWQSFRTPSEQVRLKTSAEIVNNSSTLQDDDELTGFQITPGVRYELSGLLYAFENSGGTADFKFAFTFSQAPQSFVVHMVSISATPAEDFAYGAAAGTGITVPGRGVNNQLIKITGTFQAHATTAGTMKLQWAQNSAQTNDTQLLAESWLKIAPLG